MATIITIKTAAAQAGAQTDLLRNSIHRLKSNDRNVMNIALSGGTAAGDTGGSLFVGDQNVADLTNLNTTPPTGYELIPLDAYLPGGTELRFIITDAPPSNTTVYLVLEIDDIMTEEDGGIAY